MTVGSTSRKGAAHSRVCELRHRKRCKYFETKAGCFRKGQCQYLHVDDPARETVSTEIEEEITVKKEVSVCVLEKEDKDSNMEAEENNGELDKASRKYKEKSRLRLRETKNLSNADSRTNTILERLHDLS